MLPKKYLFPVFILVVLVQLYVPFKMILDKEEVLDTGTYFKFITAPVDPTDPFRGKYITLSYKENLVVVNDDTEWVKGEMAFVLLENDTEGFAKIKSLAKAPPILEDVPFVKANIRYISGQNENEGTRNIRINYPFDRYYMEESKAYEAELAYRDARRDSTSIAYALVAVDKGEAVLKDVIINGRPIREVAAERIESIEQKEQ